MSIAQLKAEDFTLGPIGKQWSECIPPRMLPNGDSESERVEFMRKMNLTDPFLRASKLSIGDWMGLIPIFQTSILNPRIVETPLCASCSKKAKLMCSTCVLARYCSKECQAKHWKQHKTECSALKKGDTVRIMDGNNVHLQMVGQVGILHKYFKDTGKWGMQLTEDDSLVAIHKKNLVRI